MTPQEIEQIIDMLIEKLGPIGGQVWSIYVRQVYIQTAQNIAVGLLFLLAAVGFLLGGIWSAKSYLRAKNASPNHYGVGDRQAVGIIICGILGPAALVFGVIYLVSTMALFNPEYYAIQMLLGR